MMGKGGGRRRPQGGVWAQGCEVGTQRGGGGAGGGALYPYRPRAEGRDAPMPCGVGPRCGRASGFGRLGVGDVGGDAGRGEGETGGAGGVVGVFGEGEGHFVVAGGGGGIGGGEGEPRGV